MQTGKVKWFNDEKGFGFIQDSKGKDIFVHYKAIQSSGRKTLTEGQPVEFETQDTPKGLAAVNVIPGPFNQVRL